MEYTIVNVWAVVDNYTISWLQSKTREECFAFAIQVAKVIADDIYSSIKEWMEKERCYPSIVMADPFTQDNAVKAVTQMCQTGSAEWRRIIEDCRHFLSRSGRTEFGGQVAIVVGCR